MAIARESALDREREEKAIDTLHYFVVFILEPRKDGWYFCSGGSVFGLSLGDVGFFDENEGRQNHVSTSDCHGLTIYWTENKHREWWAQLDSNQRPRDYESLEAGFRRTTCDHNNPKNMRLRGFRSTAHRRKPQTGCHSVDTPTIFTGLGIVYVLYKLKCRLM